jgi:hypothetical protein
MNLSDYLEKIQNDESVFPMDSPSKSKKKRILRYYSETTTNNDNIRRAMIDLDGTIHKYSKGYQDGTIYDDPFEGAKETIDWLKEIGFEIIIFTTRASKENAEEMGGDHIKQIKNVENYLKDNEIYFDRVTSDKLAADFYIDDKAITIENGDWHSVKKILQSRMKVN